MLEYYRFKAISDLFLKGQGDEARLQLAELQRRYVALCDENSTLKMQVQEYEDILYLARNLTFDGEFYWLITGSIKQGPFCPTCYNRDGLLMRLSGEDEQRHCMACRAQFFRNGRALAIAAAVPQEPERALFSPTHNSRDASEAPRKAKIIPFSK